MIQTDRNRLYNIAYGLDNHARVRIPKKLVADISEVSENAVLSLRMRDKTRNLSVLFTESELAAIAEEIRSIVSYDEANLERKLRRVL